MENILRKLKLVAGKCRKEYKLKFLNFKISVLESLPPEKENVVNIGGWEVDLSNLFGS